MSRLVLSLNNTTEEDIAKLELPKQAKEIIKWWFGHYGVDTPVSQPDAFKELDSHQEDNAVLSVTPKQPISRILQFYRKRLGEEGVFTITKSEAPAKEEAAGDGSTKTKSSKKRRKDAPVEESADAQSASDGVL